MNARLLMIPLLGLALAAAVGAQDAAKDDLKRMEGTWRMVRAEAEGKPVPEADLKAMTLVITGNRYTVLQGDKAIEKGTHKVDPAKKPKTIDVHIEEGSDKGKDQFGIYELDADTLKVCFGGVGEPRPKEFGSKAGTKQELVVLQRQKK
jgi:uncharacterized protein (TIGR03067 family)